jgi:chromate transporter
LYATTVDINSRPRLTEIFRLFLRLGLTAFGGPAAHIALMEHEAIEKRRWLTRERFLDLVGACNLLPGPSSTQVAMALGFDRGGWAGLLIAGVCFIVPAFLATLALAWAYVHYGRLPQAQGLLYGTKPVMVAIVVQAIWRLGRMALRTWLLVVAAVASLLAALAGAPPVLVLLGMGVVCAALALSRPAASAARAVAPFPLGLASTVAATSGVAAPGLVSLLFVFLKLGVVVFGSGYVLLAFLQRDLVDHLHWISPAQLLDAVTAGQLTPGPVFTTAAFVGYLLRGTPGALVATAAIFLPSFVLAAIASILAGRMRKSRVAAAFLDGVNAAALALMASVALALGRASLIDPWTGLIAAVSAALLLRWRVNATWLILGGAVAGLLLRGHS